MNIEQIKALGAPFAAAEIQISWRKKITRLVLVVRDGDNLRELDNPAFDFPWHGDTCDDVEQMGRTVIAAAESLGLIAHGAQTAIVDLDRLAEGSN